MVIFWLSVAPVLSGLSPFKAWRIDWGLSEICWLLANIDIEWCLSGLTDY